MLWSCISLWICCCFLSASFTLVYWAAVMSMLPALFLYFSQSWIWFWDLVPNSLVGQRERNAESNLHAHVRNFLRFQEFAYYCVTSLYTWHHIPLKVNVWDTYAFCHCCAVAYIGSLIWLGKSILVLKLQQKASTRHVYEGKDVFVWLPTAFRKIICYEALPFWLQRYHWAIAINVRRLLHPKLKGFTPWVLSIGPDRLVYMLDCEHMMFHVRTCRGEV